MGGQKTSVYLSDSLAAQWRASGLTLSELIRRGLEHGSDADTLTRMLDGIVRTALREELGQSRPAVITASSPSPRQDSTPEHTPRLEHTPSPEPARKPRSCKHSNMRLSKGVCPDCDDWVSGMS